MRWGVRDEATDDHMTTELCMREIINCQRLSMGPNFVVCLISKNLAYTSGTFDRKKRKQYLFAQIFVTLLYIVSPGKNIKIRSHLVFTLNV